MKAKLLPLEGKYYGTSVEVIDDAGDSAGTVLIWFHPNRPEDYKPSERELESWNEMLKRDAGQSLYDSMTDEEKEYEISDNHYETELAYKIANKLVEVVNVRR